MDQQVYRIREDKLEKLDELFLHLAKRAKKLNQPAPFYQIEAYHDVALVDRGPQPLDWGLTNPGQHWEQCIELTHTEDRELPVIGARRYVILTLQGHAPVLNGWQLVGIIEHTTDNEIGQVIRVAPGQTCPVEYRKAELKCDHCGFIRRRTETFVICKDGIHKQIGRNCLADFCRTTGGIENQLLYAELLMSALGYLGACEGGEHGGGHIEPRHFIEDVLTLTARAIRAYGWVSRGFAREHDWKTATADIVLGWYMPDWAKYATKEEKEVLKTISADDKALAIHALEWIRAMRPQADQLEDYLYNLLVVCSDDTIKPRHFGLACSCIAAYNRAMGVQVERKKALPSNHFGEVGKRLIDLDLEVLGKNSFDTMYGVMHLYRWRAPNGDIAIWKSSVDIGMVAGDKIRVTGTVKKHDEWKGIKQTVLTRCKVEKVKEDAPVAVKEEEEVTQ